MYRTKLGEGIGNAVLNPYQCCLAYTALKLHFTSKYDYFKYNGKVNVSQTSFDTRKDKYFFVKMSKKKSPFHYMLSNFLESNNVWVGDMFTSNGEQIFKEWQSRQESASYNFKKVLKVLDDLPGGFLNQFKVNNHTYPTVYNMYKQGAISHENMLILNGVLKFIPAWNKQIDDDVIYPKTIEKLKKYRPFLEFDSDFFADILQKTVDIDEQFV